VLFPSSLSITNVHDPMLGSRLSSLWQEVRRIQVLNSASAYPATRRVSSQYQLPQYQITSLQATEYTTHNRTTYHLTHCTMAYPSSSRNTNTYQPRESVYYPQQPSFDHLTHLDECVTATVSCAEVLSSGLERLQPGIQDLPRLTKVLSNTHVSGSRSSLSLH
jgi:hypothetical protein